MSNIINMPASNRNFTAESVTDSPAYRELLAECAKWLSMVSELAFSNPQQALREIRSTQVPVELLYLKEAVLTHAVHLSGEVTK